MKLCIAGKNSIAVDCLQTALEIQKKDPKLELCVVCNRTETGQNTWQRSLRYFAEQWGVPVCGLEDVYGEKDMTFLSLEFDRLVVPDKFASDQLFNVHFSLLPAYKGMYTSAIPLLRQETYAGVTLHRIDAGIDTGPIVAQRRFPVEETDTSRCLYEKYIHNGTVLACAYLERLIYQPGEIPSQPQPVAGSSYFSRKALDYGHLEVDLCQTAQGVIDQVRAFAFREYQLPVVSGSPIVWAKASPERTFEKPGTLLENNERCLKFATVDYAVLLYKDRFAELLEACRAGELHKVREITAAYPYAYDRNDRGWTPLMVATYHNQKDVVLHLLYKGADVRAVNNNGTNLLMYAKEAYKRFGDSTLLELYQRMGLRFAQTDYRGKSLYDYCRAEGLNCHET